MKNLVMKEKLFELRDEEYAAFQAKIVPNIDPESIIGIRVPYLRDFAKEWFGTKEMYDFLEVLPHDYYEENLLHMFFIGLIKDFDECMEKTERMLPYIDNWAVCDCGAPKAFKNNKDKVLLRVREWIASKDEYTVRYGIGMLMRLYLDEDFEPEYLKLVSSVKSEEYYVKMMVAWYFATALAKQWEDAVHYIEDETLDVWTHNKTIQKSIESFRITPEQKAYLRALRRTRE